MDIPTGQIGYRGQPSLEEMHSHMNNSTPKKTSSPHVVVIGAGIVGGAIAFQLARRHARITWIDAAEPGQEASLPSFAWINGHGKNPQHYHELNRRSLDMWDRFSRQLEAAWGQSVGLTWGGELRWSATEAGAAALTARARQLQSWGYPIRLLSKEEVTALEPRLAFGPVSAATLTEIEGHVDTQRVLPACVAGVMARGGVTYWNSPVTGLRLAEKDGVRQATAVLCDDRTIACDYVVITGGPDTTALAEMAGVHAPVHHTFGCTILTEPMPPLFDNVSVVHTDRDAEPLLNVRQLPDGCVVVHGGSHGTSIDRSLGQSDEEVEDVMAAAARYFPSLGEASIRTVRRGRRPIPQDGLPIIGFAPTVANLYIAAMHSGVTLAALVGEFAAIEILDGADIAILRPYRPHRFQTA